MNKVCAFLLFFVVGCGIQPDERSNAELYPWDGKFTFETSQGFKVHVGEFNTFLDFTFPSNVELAEIVDRAWFDLQECTNLFYMFDRPVVIDYQSFVGSGVHGFVYWVDKYVYMRISNLDVFLGNATLREEMLHYLLFLDGINFIDNQQHQSVFFDTCT